MSEDLIHLRFPENYGRAWVELLESTTLSEHARICYVAMTSFGPESRAGKESIRRRMGVKSVTTVKAAQKELAQAGWILCATRGGGVKPTVWDVFSKPYGGQLPLLGSETPSTGAPSAPVGGSQRPTPGRSVPPKQEVNQENPKPAAAAAKHPEEGRFWQHHIAAWQKDHPGAPAPAWPNRKGFQKALTEMLGRLGVDEAIRRHDNLRFDPWAQDKTIAALVNSQDKWINRRGPGGNAGQNKRELPPV